MCAVGCSSSTPCRQGRPACHLQKEVYRNNCIA
jgi:hypothetical protein